MSLTDSDGLEQQRASEWLYRVFTDDEELSSLITGAYDSTAPEGALFPFINFVPIDTGDFSAMGGRIIWVETLWQIRVTGRTSNYDDLSPIYARMHQLINRRGSKTGDPNVLKCFRIRAHQLPERDNGVDYRHYGGEYIIRAR